MTHLSYIVAAYGLTIGATVGLVGWSFGRMRRAEAQAEAVRGRK